MGLTCFKRVAVTKTLKVFIRYRGVKPMYGRRGDITTEVELKEIYLYRCSVHSVVCLINTPTNASIFI